MAEGRAPALADACFRLAQWLDESPHPLSEGLRRADLVALLAAVGWNVTADQARVDEPVVDVDMFGGGS